MRGFLLILACPGLCAGERINHEGRILGDLPAVSAPILFNTPQADAVVAAMQIMPRDSAWNEDISLRPVLANSDAMIARITADLDPDRRKLRLFEEMNFALVQDSQPTVPITFFQYPNESDYDGGTKPVGMYPIPPNLPVETWPTGTGDLSLADWQVDIDGEGGDRHSIIVKPGAGIIWETWLTKRIGSAWRAANGARFALDSNAQRPAGWTSADTAGLPMFPALVRYDEVQRGMVEHAMRIVVKHTRREYIYPASHHASNPSSEEPDLPAMGQRLRLKSSFAIPANWTLQEKAVLLALKKYGAMVADNGNFFSISITPDERYPDECFDHLRSINISSFEVIQTTGPTGGPRSPGAPSVNAGPDVSLMQGGTASLSGMVTNGTAATVLWKKYSGPGTVSFGSNSLAATTATFSIPGSYTLLLSAMDGTHAPAYDALVVEVRLPVTLVTSGRDQIVRFPGVPGQRCRVQRSFDLASWETFWDQTPASGGLIEVVHPNALDLPEMKQFYRVLVGP